jgi:hypothetical protein
MILTVLAIGTLFGTVVGVFVGYYIGRRQITIADEEHNLNLLKSSPKIDTTVRINERQVNPFPAYDPFHFIVTGIHNYGDLAARHLKGHWRVYSPDKSIQECDIPIVRDFLGSTPYEFEPFQLVGPNIDGAIKRGAGRATINVDVEFDYFGVSQDQPQHYSARWQFDSSSKQMVRV